MCLFGQGSGQKAFSFKPLVVGRVPWERPSYESVYAWEQSL